jgi:hypothetical protein
MGEEEILITPLNGVYRAIIMKTAQENGERAGYQCYNYCFSVRREETETDEDEGQPQNHNSQ